MAFPLKHEMRMVAFAVYRLQHPYDVVFDDVQGIVLASLKKSRRLGIFVALPHLDQAIQVHIVSF